MLKNIVPFFSVAAETASEIFRSFKAQSLSRGYLLAFALFLIAVIFSFLALNPILYSFVYPLF